MTIQRIERGEVLPTAATLAALTFALQVPMEDLLAHPNPHDRLAPADSQQRPGIASPEPPLPSP